MRTLLSDINRKAIKDHKCNGCGRLIKKGEVYNKQSIADDGSVYCFKRCFDCFSFCQKCKDLDCECCDIAEARAEYERSKCDINQLFEVEE